MKKGQGFKSLYLPAWTIVAAVVVLLGVISVSTYRNLSRETGRMEEALLREGQVIIRALEAGVRANTPEGVPDEAYLQKLLAEAAREPEVAGIVLFNDEGTIVAASTPPSAGQRVGEAASLRLLIAEKGAVTRYRGASGKPEAFEILLPFRPFAYGVGVRPVPTAGTAGATAEAPLRRWAGDKMIGLSLRLATFEQVRMEDRHHNLLMAGIMLALGAGALFFLFIVQNYYRVDLSLRRMEGYTENVVESMADGLISVDREARIVTLNRRAARIVGAAGEALQGKGIGEVLGPEIAGLLGAGAGRRFLRDREIAFVPLHGREARAALSAERGSGSAAPKNATGDGVIAGEAGIPGRPGFPIRDGAGRAPESAAAAPVPLSVSVAPLTDESGAELGSVLLIRDLREIRELQERVSRSERLASLGRLAAGMAHEIRNPLSSIRGFAQYFQKRFSDQAQEREYAAIMVKEVDRLNRVITDLLDFARPREPHREIQALAPIADHALEILGPDLAARKVRAARLYTADLPPVPVDRDQFLRVFINLILNAAEAMEAGGEITIALERSAAPGGVGIAVSDTGAGIAPEDADKIFEPFFSRKKKGTGLGLAIVHQIVAGHGGTIGVESAPGQGTSFRIFLPQDEAPRPAAAGPPGRRDEEPIPQ
jgi:two-component system sensor histidine kinase HydH